MNHIFSQNDIALLDYYCLRNDLSTHDRYDIWTWRPGFLAKKLYNCNRLAALPFVVPLALFDRFNPAPRFLPKREYPIVRAMATLILLKLYLASHAPHYLAQAEKNLEWLLEHHGKSESGLGWGVLVPRTVSAEVFYPPDMTFSTVTPYVLEAFFHYSRITKNRKYAWVMEKLFTYFTVDIKVLFEDEKMLATSYSTIPDRIVVNAVSYSLYARALLSVIFPERKAILKTEKLHNFVKSAQSDNGAWLYQYHNPHSFIDCFHTCFILKNLIKSSRLTPLPGADEEIFRGWEYLKNHLYNPKEKLFRRFSIANKPGIIKYDLYDNAEALNVANLLGDDCFAVELKQSIAAHFMVGKSIFSQIDIWNRRFSPEHLRWAVMPYLLALSNALPEGAVFHA